MSKKPCLAASILDADFARLGPCIAAAAAGGVEALHLDIMDGCYVPNLSFGPPVVRSIRAVTSLPLDAHLMVTEPTHFFAPLATSGVTTITFHAETVDDIPGAIAQLKALNIRAGLAVNPDQQAAAVIPYLDLIDHVLVMSVRPGFGGQTLIPQEDKITRLRAAIAKSGRPITLWVDGGINATNIQTMVRAQVDGLVVGSALFKSGFDQITPVTRTLKELIDAA